MFVDSPGVPPSANAHELFRGFSFIAPFLLDTNNSPELKAAHEAAVNSNFSNYINPTSVNDEYEFHHELGRGSYSTVYLAVHKATKIEYAIKVRWPI